MILPKSAEDLVARILRCEIFKKKFLNSDFSFSTVLDEGVYIVQGIGYAYCAYCRKAGVWIYNAKTFYYVDPKLDSAVREYMCSVTRHVVVRDDDMDIFRNRDINKGKKLSAYFGYILENKVQQPTGCEEENSRKTAT